MTRKECIDYIKSNGYSAEATELARDYAQNNHANYTNLPTEALMNFVALKEANKKAITNKSAQKAVKAEPLSECTDKGARKAIRALAAYIGFKNIERNF